MYNINIYIYIILYYILYILYYILYIIYYIIYINYIYIFCITLAKKINLCAQWSLYFFCHINKVSNGFPNMKSELSAHRWVTWSKTLAGQTVNFDSGESLTALFVQPVSSWTMMRWKTKRPTRQTKMEWSSFGEKPLKKHKFLKWAFTRAFSRMQVVCFMLVCLHYGPGSVRRVGWMGRMFAVCGTMRVIWFLLELMLVCSHHKVGNFISDPRVHSKIWLDVSYAPLGPGLTWFSCASMSIYLQCWVGSFVTLPVP